MSRPLAKGRAVYGDMYKLSPRELLIESKRASSLAETETPSLRDAQCVILHRRATREGVSKAWLADAHAAPLPRFRLQDYVASANLVGVSSLVVPTEMSFPQMHVIPTEMSCIDSATLESSFLFGTACGARYNLKLQEGMR